ncbi:helix-turn-helix domain-containing protein [Brevibacterium sp. S111]|uniref:helix-turn-helix transcriptional regulator n=1 Tax=Brevibacterium sp. S111 TaxID=2483795 RepID=UPI001080C0F0|nr:helix-turn-helix domain-containing protein [Brevibacterium sp. S111]TGD12065.1 DNA-binding protein [Brevibacterium sp. S111]
MPTTTRSIPQRAYTTGDAATYLGISRHTLEAWRVKGTGPDYRRVGNGPRARALYMVEDLDRWLDSLDCVGGGRA